MARMPVDLRQHLCLSNVQTSTVLGQEHPSQDFESGFFILGNATGEIGEKS